MAEGCADGEKEEMYSDLVDRVGQDEHVIGGLPVLAATRHSPKLVLLSVFALLLTFNISRHHGE